MGWPVGISSGLVGVWTRGMLYFVEYHHVILLPPWTTSSTLLQEISTLIVSYIFSFKKNLSDPKLLHGSLNNILKLIQQTVNMEMKCYFV